MENRTVPEVSGNRTQPQPASGDSPQTLAGQSPKTVENSQNPQVEALPGTVGHFKTVTPPERAQCGECGEPLNRHNITGLCAECKLVARNARMSRTPVKSREPVVLADAIAAVMACFPNAKEIQ
jgi:hypothetical protein